jgi:hypothetical protein
MSDQFWSSVVGALAGALTAGIISALIAHAVFKAERKARETETDADRKRRGKERQEEAREAIVRLRTLAVSELVALIRAAGNSGGFGSIPPAIQNAAQALLLDRTDESYIVFRWVMLKLGYIADCSARGQGNVARPKSPRQSSPCSSVGFAMNPACFRT